MITHYTYVDEMTKVTYTYSYSGENLLMVIRSTQLDTTPFLVTADILENTLHIEGALLRSATKPTDEQLKEAVAKIEAYYRQLQTSVVIYRSLAPTVQNVQTDVKVVNHDIYVTSYRNQAPTDVLEFTIKVTDESVLLYMEGTTQPLYEGKIYLCAIDESISVSMHIIKTLAFLSEVKDMYVSLEEPTTYVVTNEMVVSTESSTETIVNAPKEYVRAIGDDLTTYQRKLEVLENYYCGLIGIVKGNQLCTHQNNEPQLLHTNLQKIET